MEGGRKGGGIEGRKEGVAEMKSLLDGRKEPVIEQGREGERGREVMRQVKEEVRY